ncbi:MAG: N-acetylmuramoyl-L-alanine amidase [Clostridia bacterium]|jgi:N-acetylmuramoyl-L-alanine amidase
MKKTLSVILVLMLIVIETISVVTVSAAVDKGVYKIKCISIQSQATVEVYLGSFSGYSTMYLTEPNRVVLDIAGSGAPPSQTTLNFSSKYLKSVRYAMRGSNSARVVVDLIGKPDYKIVKRTGKILILFTNPITKGLSYFVDDLSANIMFKSQNLYISGKKKYTEKYELSGKRYTITYSNNIINLKSITKNINDKYLKSLKVVNDSKKKTTSIVIDAVAKFKFNPLTDTAIKSTIINIPKIAESDRGNDPRDSDNTLKGVSYFNSKGDIHLTINDTKIVDENMKRFYSGAYSASNLTYTIKFKTSFANIANGILTINDSVFKNVQITKDLIAGSTSIILNAKAKYAYNLTYDVKTRKTTIKLIKLNPVKSMVYSRNGDRVCLVVAGANLAERVYNSSIGSSELKKYYKQSYESSGSSCTLTFPKTMAASNIGTGVYLINDDFVNSIEVWENTVQKTVSITFNTTQKFNYNAVTRTDSGLSTRSYITILKPYKLSDKLVVIDAGHGGYDSGAAVGDVYESNINLEISLKLNELLKGQGVNSYLIRSDDIFIGLYERAYIANTLNASLFLCIHNNASDSESANGTETFYTTRSSVGYMISSYDFALNVQNSLISTLKSYNRGAPISWPGLAVLKTTKMPAILTEIGFVSNTAERAKLLSETYQKSAAKALCNAIIASLK